jgi:hypothetical protein
VKSESIRQVLQKSKQTEEPLFVIYDDTISKKTKPSSQATSPMEQTGFHHSHLEGKVVWGHQVQAAVMACGDMALIHSIDLYDPTNIKPDGSVYTKIERVCDRAGTMPLPPHGGYALVDSWFTCPKVIDSCAAAGVSPDWWSQNESDSLSARHPNFRTGFRLPHPKRRRSPCDRERIFVLDVPL